MPIDTARASLRETLKAVSGSEEIPLVQAAGRVLAAPVIAVIDLPPCDNSAMDGYALRYADLQTGQPLALIGKSFAGAPFAGTLNSGTCVRIMTGIVVPTGADTIVMQKQVKAHGESIQVNTKVHLGDHGRCRGEDVREGQTLLEAGIRVSIAQSRCSPRGVGQC